MFLYEVIIPQSTGIGSSSDLIMLVAAYSEEQALRLANHELTADTSLEENLITYPERDVNLLGVLTDGVISYKRTDWKYEPK